MLGVRTRHVRKVHSPSEFPRHCPVCNSKMPRGHTFAYSCTSMWLARNSGDWFALNRMCVPPAVRRRVLHVEAT